MQKGLPLDRNNPFCPQLHAFLQLQRQISSFGIPPLIDFVVNLFQYFLIPVSWNKKADLDNQAGPQIGNYWMLNYVLNGSNLSSHGDIPPFRNTGCCKG